VELASGATCLVVTDGEAPAIGSAIGLTIDLAKTHAFDAEGLACAPQTAN
jgi:hypothetical protein